MLAHGYRLRWPYTERMEPTRPTDPIVLQAAELVVDAFADYDARFADITRRARRRFERRDWAGARQDAVARIGLYDQCIAETFERLERRLGGRMFSRSLWTQVRGEYARLIAEKLDAELNKTFFNTLTRRAFKMRGVDPSIEFVALDIEPTDRITHPVARHSYVAGDDLSRLFQRVLADYPFAVPYANPARCAEATAAALRLRLRDWVGEPPMVALELLQTVFFRERRAYLVGRLFGRERHSPFVIALVNEDDAGIRVDAVLTDRADVSVLFGYTRSYFHADLPTVGDAVVFLRGLLPNKPVAELYTVLGRAKQGKTERYRDFFHHLGHHGEERFVHADGERGMVMAVFTLPSYPLVFKLIRDKFAFPKNIAREQVREKYDLVFRHDRIGRLVDAQEFRHLRFSRRQFTDELLAELEQGCRHSVVFDGDDLVIVHCYIERRLRPLNLYLREAPPENARAALLDYGQAIKDLARSNIFPGDLLFKNFGISGAGRAVFYDYDELCLVTECRFRHIPQARYEEDEFSHETWYHVGENDVFPAQFPRFLGLAAEQRALLLDVHGEIFDVDWWQQVRTDLLAGAYADIPPYPESARLPAPRGVDRD